MTSILDATSGGPASNAYCTAAEATTYLSQHRNFTDTWTAATTAQKEAAIIWATRQMDELIWHGVKTNRTTGQALRWPRTGLLDRDLLIIDGTVVPQFIKDATAEWAFVLVTEDRTLDEGGLVQYGGKIGPITDPTMYARKTLPGSVKDIIGRYTESTTGNGRVFRI